MTHRDVQRTSGAVDGDALSNQANVEPRVAMIQPGARLRYAVPLALQRAGILERMYTSFYVKPGSMSELSVRLMSRWNPPLGRRMAGRRCEELDDRKIFRNSWLGIRGYMGYKTHSVEQMLRHGGRSAKWIRRRGFGQANAVMGFVRSVDPALLEHCRDRGMVVVADQLIAPVAVEAGEIARQSERFPGWEPAISLDAIRRYEDVQMQSWQALHHITCASAYVRDGILAHGIAPSRVSVLPYPIDTEEYAAVDRSGRNGPLTVGCMGAVTIRKGAPYFFEVAKRFKPSEARFVMVGRVGLDPAVATRHRGNVELIGVVHRSQVARWLAQFDVFFFPTTCEGSAVSVIEAMATGLPVVTSRNSGTFARDGDDGFLRPYDDVDGNAECIRRLLGDDHLRSSMGESARRRVLMYDVDHYARQIAQVFRDLLNPTRTPSHACG